MGSDKKANKAGKGKTAIWIIIILLVLSALGSISDSGGSSYNQNSSKHKAARETAELAIQNDLGYRCYTESKVVYENDTYIIVAVKYGLSEDDDSYWVTFVRCYGSGEYWNSKINGNGIDYDNISQEIIDELKLRWEMK